MDFEEFKKTYQKVEVEHYTNSVPENVTVSVLVQTYNHENFLKQCLDSILDQKTNFDFEILLGEDNSTDSTRNICIEYAKKYPEKIRLFLHYDENKIKVNGIITGNFNALFNFYNAKGRYIAFCEGDDYWTDPYKLQKQAGFLEKNGAYSLCFHPYKVLQHGSIPDPGLIEQPTTDITSEELQQLKQHPLLSTVCFRNSLASLPSQIPEIINVDSFLLSLLGGKGDAKYISEIRPGIYRKHQEGIWAGRFREKKFLSKIHTYTKLKEFYVDRKIISLANNFEQEVRNTYKMLLYFLIRKGEIYKATKLAFRILNGSLI
ncbi:glycosyltransferase family A protein [Pontixanthobacter gangjinensis]|uniref:Glycosyltransferase n=1 Tax=Christiangramia aestuarii TaxID=1028746 RepID=A0A7M3SWS1_9FLAO|nr:glycosyltransferase [Christiangramia aestuarii]MUP41052.1 glycosyltransferase [Christiangramia aestuarii]